MIFKESGRRDSDPRPPAPKAGALPGCATPRKPEARGPAVSESAVSSLSPRLRQAPRRAARARAGAAGTPRRGGRSRPSPPARAPPSSAPPPPRPARTAGRSRTRRSRARASPIRPRQRPVDARDDRPVGPREREDGDVLRAAPLRRQPGERAQELVVVPLVARRARRRPGRARGAATAGSSHTGLAGAGPVLVRPARGADAGRAAERVHARGRSRRRARGMPASRA